MPTAWLRRNEQGAIVEMYMTPPVDDPAELARDYEETDTTDPELLRFVDPGYSLKAEARKRFMRDPLLRIIVEWIRLGRGLTQAQARAELDAIADEILAD